MACRKEKGAMGEGRSEGREGNGDIPRKGGYRGKSGQRNIRVNSFCPPRIGGSDNGHYKLDIGGGFSLAHKKTAQSSHSTSPKRKEDVKDD